MRERRIDADHLGVALRVHQAREAVAGLAADAAALLRIRFVEHDPERHVERAQPVRRQVVVQLLDARLVLHGREPVRRARPRLGRIDAALAVDLIEVLGLRVVRLELVVADRPRRRDAAVVANLAEVLLAQPEQRGAVELGVAADVVVGVRMERLAVLVLPHFLGVVLRLDVDRPRAPVVLLAADVVAALEQQDPLAGRGEVIGERAAARAGADDDHVVVRHAGALISDPGRANADIRKVGASMPGSGQRFQGEWPMAADHADRSRTGALAPQSKMQRSVVRVVQLGADAPGAAPKRRVNSFGRQQHAKRRSREVDPQDREVAASRADPNVRAGFMLMPDSGASTVM